MRNFVSKRTSPASARRVCHVRTPRRLSTYVTGGLCSVFACQCYRSSGRELAGRPLCLVVVMSTTKWPFHLVLADLNSVFFCLLYTVTYLVCNQVQQRWVCQIVVTDELMTKCISDDLLYCGRSGFIFWQLHEGILLYVVCVLMQIRSLHGLLTARTSLEEMIHFEPESNPKLARLSI